MELFIPSFTILLVTTLVLLFLLPRFSPYILGTASIALFCVGLFQHYTTFPYEYSKYWLLLKDSSPYITIGLLIVVLMMVFGGSSSSTNSSSISSILPASIRQNLPAMPAMPTLPSVASITGNTPRNIFGRNTSLASTSFKTV